MNFRLRVECRLVSRLFNSAFFDLLTVLSTNARVYFSAKLMSDMDFKTRRKHLTENPEIIDCVEVPIITSSIQPDLPAGYTRRIVRVPESGGNLQPLPDEELLQRPEVIEFREYLKTSSAANTRQLFIDLRPAKPE